jgi:hypothetical protein
MSFGFRKSVRIMPGVLVLMLGACASPSSPSSPDLARSSEHRGTASPEYQAFLANSEERVAKAIADAKWRPGELLAEQKALAAARASTPQPTQVTTRAPAHLTDMVDASAPIAARAAQCGYWNGEQWYYEVIKVDVKQGLDGALGARFAERFNHALETGEGDGMGVSCTFAYNIALDYLVLWGQAGD